MHGKIRNIRAKLKPVRRRKKDGTTYWAARGFVPVRTPDGSIARRRVEHSLGGDTAKARQEETDRLNRLYEERALAIERPLTFAKAYTNYIELGHPVPIYGEQILKHIGLMQCQDIDDTVMVELTKKLFRPDAKPSYINRHLYTPVMAVLRLALKGKAPQLSRPKGYKDKNPNIAIPNATWFRAVFPHMGPDTRALLLFMTMHGRRLGDALGRKPSDFDPEEGTLIVERTKTGDPLMIDLHPQVVRAFLEMPDWQRRRWLFRDGPTSGSNVRKDVTVACLKANGIDPRMVEEKGGWKRAARLLEDAPIPYYSPHEIGRHAFATRLLRAGYSLQYVKDAGGWKTIEVVSQIYGHLERKEWTMGVHKVGDALIDQIEGQVVSGYIPDDSHIPPTVSSSSPPVRSTFDVNEQ